MHKLSWVEVRQRDGDRFKGLAAHQIWAWAPASRHRAEGRAPFDIVAYRVLAAPQANLNYVEEVEQ